MAQEVDDDGDLVVHLAFLLQGGRQKGDVCVSVCELSQETKTDLRVGGLSPGWVSTCWNTYCNTSRAGPPDTQLKELFGCLCCPPFSVETFPHPSPCFYPHSGYFCSHFVLSFFLRSNFQTFITLFAFISLHVK